jgi:SAM-dependent methyltransferase
MAATAPEAHHLATEKRGAEGALKRLPDIEERSAVMMRRLEGHVPATPPARVLDIGAAQGLLVAALRKRGYDAVGIEPWREAIETGKEIAARTGVDFEIVEGMAESLPFADESFDLVISIAVMEHVGDPLAVFREVQRVLRPGGGYYFYTDSAICPKQSEIKRFPFFPWYPPRLKRAIMRWAAEKKPHLIGHTEMPAYHWYTPWGARRIAAQTGFSQVMDRWELKREDELEGWKRLALRLARWRRGTRLAADVFVPDCAYLFVKGGAATADEPIRASSTKERAPDETIRASSTKSEAEKPH